MGNTLCWRSRRRDTVANSMPPQQHVRKTSHLARLSAVACFLLGVAQVLFTSFLSTGIPHRMGDQCASFPYLSERAFTFAWVAVLCLLYVLVSGIASHELLLPFFQQRQRTPYTYLLTSIFLACLSQITAQVARLYSDTDLDFLYQVLVTISHLMFWHVQACYIAYADWLLRSQLGMNILLRTKCCCLIGVVALAVRAVLTLGFQGELLTVRTGLRIVDQVFMASGFAFFMFACERIRVSQQRGHPLLRNLLLCSTTLALSSAVAGIEQSSLIIKRLLFHMAGASEFFDLEIGIFINLSNHWLPLAVVLMNSPDLHSDTGELRTLRDQKVRHGGANAWLLKCYLYLCSAAFFSWGFHMSCYPVSEAAASKVVKGGLAYAIARGSAGAMYFVFPWTVATVWPGFVALLQYISDVRALSAEGETGYVFLHRTLSYIFALMVALHTLGHFSMVHSSGGIDKYTLVFWRGTLYRWLLPFCSGVLMDVCVVALFIAYPCGKDRCYDCFIHTKRLCAGILSALGLFHGAMGEFGTPKLFCFMLLTCLFKMLDAYAMYVMTDKFEAFATRYDELPISRKRIIVLELDGRARQNELIAPRCSPTNAPIRTAVTGLFSRLVRWRPARQVSSNASRLSRLSPMSQQLGAPEIGSHSWGNGLVHVEVDTISGIHPFTLVNRASGARELHILLNPSDMWSRRANWSSRVAMFIAGCFEERQRLVPLRMSGPWPLGSLGNKSLIERYHAWVLIAFGVGFTGCAEALAVIKEALRERQHSNIHDCVAVFCRSRFPLYVDERVRPICAEHGVTSVYPESPISPSRQEFWNAAHQVVDSLTQRYGSHHVAIVTCGSDDAVGDVYREFGENVSIIAEKFPAKGAQRTRCTLPCIRNPLASGNG